MHLLILDDEERICTFVADVATGAGWTVDTASHKLDFRSHVFRRLPDAVILDLHLGETEHPSADHNQTLWISARHAYSHQRPET
jgi:DNA-binding response OmpR family regulator